MFDRRAHRHALDLPTEVTGHAFRVKVATSGLVRSSTSGVILYGGGIEVVDLVEQRLIDVRVEREVVA
jgi:hypothetical protein